MHRASKRNYIDPTLHLLHRFCLAEISKKYITELILGLFLGWIMFYNQLWCLWCHTALYMDRLDNIPICSLLTHVITVWPLHNCNHFVNHEISVLYDEKCSSVHVIQVYDITDHSTITWSKWLSLKNKTSYIYTVARSWIITVLYVRSYNSIQ